MGARRGQASFPLSLCKAMLAKTLWPLGGMLRIVNADLADLRILYPALDLAC